MAACCKGNRIPSAVTACWMVLVSTVTTCTGTPGCFSPESLEQPESKSNGAVKPTITHLTDCRRAKSRALFMGLEIPRKGLQICQRHPVTGLPIAEGIARQRGSVLRINHLQHGRFSGLIAQRRQVQAL